MTARPVLIGTWAAATWAVRFYEKHGFRLVTPEEKNRLLKKYWSIPDRQVDTSVVLGDEHWFRYRQPLVHHRDEAQPIDCPFGNVQRIVTGGAGGVANVPPDSHLFQSRNATDAMALERFSVFISTRCQPSSRIVAWSGWVILPRT